MEDFEAVPLDELPSKKLYCITKRSGFNGYGFTLATKKKTQCHLVTNVEDVSPAQIAGLKNNDKILEVNGIDVRRCRHADLVYRIRSSSEELKLLVEPARYQVDNNVNGEKHLITKTTVDGENAAPNLAGKATTKPIIDEKDVELRLCQLKLWPGATSYGFFLHEERGKPGQCIGKVESQSVAEASGLREGDRVLQINGTDVSNAKHDTVVSLFRQNPSEVKIFVTDLESERFLVNRGITVSGELSYVKHINCPDADPLAACNPSEVSTSDTNSSVVCTPDSNPNVILQNEVNPHVVCEADISNEELEVKREN